jgi:integrase
LPRKPKPYVKDGHYCTSVGGIQHRKLCSVEQGMRQADIELAKLIVLLDDVKRNGGQPTTVAPNSPLAASPVLRATYPSVPQAIDDFMTFVKSETSEATYGWYQQKLWPLYERFSDWPVNKLTYQEGLKYKTWLREEKAWRKGKAGTVRKGLGNTTVNQHIRAARTFLEWCCKPSRRHVYGVAMNPWEEITYLTEKPRERLITDEEFQHLLAHCEDGNTRGAADDMREQLLVVRYTTMRPQELRLLKWDYIQWDQHRIVYPATVVKTRKRRELSMIDVVEETLAERKRRLEAMGIRLTGRYVFPLPARREGVLTAGIGERHQAAGKFAQRFRRLVERCVGKGLVEKEKAGERIVPYSTRHTRITELIVEENTQAVVMFDAGHTNPLTTERYKHLASSHVTQSIRKNSQKSGLIAGSAGLRGQASASRPSGAAAGREEASAPTPAPSSTR